MIKRHLTSSARLIAVFLTCHVCVTSHAYEQSVKCREIGDPDPSAYPYESTIKVHPSEAGRAVEFGASWKADALRYIGEYGLEFKTHQYNYDDAATTGKGPAYVLGPVDDSLLTNFCDLPGCYVDSDFLSEKNSSDEYLEPQVAIGVKPGQGHNLIAGQRYSARINAVPGRGNSSLMKVLYYTTKRKAPIGVSGIFHCSDVYVKNVVKFQDGFFAPACLYSKDISVDRC